MMLRAVGTALLVGLFVLAPLTALPKVGGGDVEFKPKGAGKVVFAHEYHVNLKGQKCSNCHHKTFQMKGGESTYKMDMSLLTKGEFCGICHDGKKGFDVKAADSCTRCHKE
jgi:c(7)-type cytochrome triheme protein